MSCGTTSSIALPRDGAPTHRGRPSGRTAIRANDSAAGSQGLFRSLDSEWTRPSRVPRPFGCTGCDDTLLVEVPGIEPGSFVASMGILRAQCAVPLLGPTDHAHESV